MQKKKKRGNLETMVERALRALRSAPNATFPFHLLRSPLQFTLEFEAHQGREANTVLKNLTKKTSLQNLNWEKVSRQKSACIDNEDPRNPCMPQPTQTNWIERSDNESDAEHNNHPRKLPEDQLVTWHGETQNAKGLIKSFEFSGAIGHLPSQASRFDQAKGRSYC